MVNEAGVRIHGSTYKKPLDLFESEHLKSLPKTMPDIAIWSKVRGSRTAMFDLKSVIILFLLHFMIRTCGVRKRKRRLRFILREILLLITQDCSSQEAIQQIKITLNQRLRLILKEHLSGVLMKQRA